MDIKKALWRAVYEGDAGCLQTLLSYPYSDPNDTYDDGCTLLHTAVIHGDVACATALLKHTDINPNKADKDGETPLHVAAYQDARKATVCRSYRSRVVDHTACVAALLAHPRIRTDKLDGQGRSPLHCAIYPHAAHSELGSLQMLLDHPDVDVNRLVWRDSETAGLSPVIYVILSLSCVRYVKRPVMSTVIKTLLNHVRVDLSGAYEYLTRIYRGGKWANDSYDELSEAIAAEDRWRRRRVWIKKCVMN